MEFFLLRSTSPKVIRSAISTTFPTWDAGPRSTSRSATPLLSARKTPRWCCVALIEEVVGGWWSVASTLSPKGTSGGSIHQDLESLQKCPGHRPLTTGHRPMRRIESEELLDHDVAPEEMERSLRDLRMFNRVFGGIRAYRMLVRRLRGEREHFSILDLGTGSSDLLGAFPRAFRVGLDLKIEHLRFGQA